jgi:hypothetical protein
MALGSHGASGGLQSRSGCPSRARAADAAASALLVLADLVRGCPRGNLEIEFDQELRGSSLSEGEHVRLDTRLEEHDLERSVGHLAGLPDELVKTSVGEQPVAVVVDVDAV